jgi:hypothetical protein
MLRSVLLEALDVRVCRLETLAAQSVCGDLILEAVMSDDAGVSPPLVWDLEVAEE